MKYSRVTRCGRRVTKTVTMGNDLGLREAHCPRHSHWSCSLLRSFVFVLAMEILNTFYINSICFWTNKILNSVAYSIMNLKSLSSMKSRQILVCFLLLPCRYSSLSNCGIKSCTTSEWSSHNCWSPKASCDVDLSENQNYTWTAVMVRIVSSLLMSSEALCCVG